MHMNGLLSSKYGDCVTSHGRPLKDDECVTVITLTASYILKVDDCVTSHGRPLILKDGEYVTSHGWPHIYMIATDVTSNWPFMFQF